MKTLPGNWSPQSKNEEWINGLTHGLGALVSIPGTVVLIVQAVRMGDARRVVGVSIFGATLLLLYTVSTLYHALPLSVAKSRFRVFDHIAIYLLIAGSYTPFTLGPLRGGWGWSLFGVVWGLALLGTVLKLLFMGRFRIMSVVVYIAMGWMVVIAVHPLRLTLEPVSLGLLVAGGLAYTGGIVFYANRWMPFSHGVWHLFVLAGSILHWFAVYTLPAYADL